MTDTEDTSGDILNILIASDIHLGYAEKDPIRGEDSFVTFEEILNIAVKREVDLILLGGDLFHDAKPSQKCLHEATRLLRKYCMGDKPVPIEFLSDQSENFQHCVNPVVNYEDPNLNVAIPVFSIHGNHDDPTGLGRLSTLDLLSVSGLVNYFGKWTDLKQIKISPLLMRKGKTKLGLYGLSYIKDERLSRLFRDRKVQLFQPKEATNEWFNIFVLHQNRADRGPNNCLPEDALPNFLDVVVWGHEHECRIIPEENPTQHFKVIQPGSPVATSLCEGEAKEKHVGILKIYKKKYELEPIKLKTVRPFLMDTLTLSETTINYVSDKVSEATQNHVRDYIAHMIEESKVQITGHRKQPELPLIRLRVEYNDEKQVFNPMKFGLQFSTQVANPRDIVLLKKERAKRDMKDSADLDKDTLKEIIERANETDKIETLVEKYFTDVDPNKTLQVLSIKGLNEALSHYIEKSDTEAISDLINHQVKKTAKFLKENVEDVDNIKEALENYRAIRTASNEDVVKEAQSVLSGKNRNSTNNGVDNPVTISDDDDDSDVEVRPSTSTSSARGRGRGRGRGSRGGKQASETTRATSGNRGGSRVKKPLDVSKTLVSNTSRSSSGRKIKQMDFSDSD